MTTLIISDLHLTPEDKAITEAFIAFMANRAANSQALYVLGDLFESWVGDDHESELGDRVIAAFRDYVDAGGQLFLMHGNRDFLLGERFAKAAGATLLKEETVVEWGGERVLLMHGDSLCTGDSQYMAFRAMVRQPAWQAAMLGKPLAERLTIAQALRQQSQMHNANKAENIMDVAPAEVENMIRKHGVSTLLHGHTHRPDSHALTIDGRPCRRLVTGDWHGDGSAVIAIVDAEGLRLSPL